MLSRRIPRTLSPALTALSPVVVASVSSILLAAGLYGCAHPARNGALVSAADALPVPTSRRARHVESVQKSSEYLHSRSLFEAGDHDGAAALIAQMLARPNLREDDRA